MGKKKQNNKKGRVSFAPDDHPTSPSPLVVKKTPDSRSEKHSNVQGQGEDAFLSDHLLVRCITSVSGGNQGGFTSLNISNSKTTFSAANITAAPLLTLSESDARRLDLGPDDRVFVFPCDGRIKDSYSRHQLDPSNPIAGCTICRTQIAADIVKSHSSPKIQSPPSSRRHNPQNQLAAGRVHLYPPSLVAFLWPIDTQNQDTQSQFRVLQNDDNFGGESFSSTPVSTEKGNGFSFKDFTAKLDDRKSLSSSKKIESLGQRHLWIVPVSSNLGSHILQSGVVSVARAESVRLTLRYTTDERTISGSMLEASRNIMERLARATLTGRFVQVGESVHFSFHGRTVEFITTILTGEKSSDKSSSSPTLEHSFCEMELDERDDGNKMTEGSHVPFIEQLILNLQSLHVELFLLCSGTKFEFVDTSPPIELTATEPERLEAYVAGISSVVQQVKKHLLVPLTRSHLFSHSKGILPPRGLLLHGPSGVGKTCVAKQIAHELKLEHGCHVDFVSCMSLLTKSSIVGEAERELCRCFRASTVPRLLVFDDVHLICARRGGPLAQGADQLAATLLALMDGVEHPAKCGSPLAILAVTNDPSVLDPALRRPGRLDFEVEIPIPDEPSERLAILRFHMDQMGIDRSSMTDDEMLEVAKNAKGFNGADCLLLVKAAARLSFRRQNLDFPLNYAQMTKEDLVNAMKTVRPSAIKAVTVEIPQVLWSDIGGMDRVKESLREAIEIPLSQHELFVKLQIPPPRGILLYGPPGTGKTMIARALATEGKMNFLTVKGPELLSKWLGESERALASLFRRARMASPSIIFFDEIDAIATKRGSSDNTTGSRMLSQLLSELDGVASTGGRIAVARDRHSEGEHRHQATRVLVIGATNRPDLLDTALTRPGRIDRMVYVGLPDEKSREKVFEVALKTRACGNDLDLSRLATDEVSGGYSGAEIVGICREAALVALEDHLKNQSDVISAATPTIKMQHLLQVVRATRRQITREMLGFYESFRQT
ncbi:hypothetical protein ACA910_021051 [Epithemia clementina (nom. ined.)]